MRGNLMYFYMEDLPDGTFIFEGQSEHLLI